MHKVDLTSYTKASKAVPETKPYRGQQAAPQRFTNINEPNDIKPHSNEYQAVYREDR